MSIPMPIPIPTYRGDLPYRVTIFGVRLQYFVSCAEYVANYHRLPAVSHLPTLKLQVCNFSCVSSVSWLMYSVGSGRRTKTDLSRRKPEDEDGCRYQFLVPTIDSDFDNDGQRLTSHRCQLSIVNWKLVAALGFEPRTCGL